MNEQRLKSIEKDILLIKARNSKVEADKAWEVSWLRRLLISVLTYLIAVLTLYLSGVENYLTGALIPAVGFLLSTLSLPLIKKWWLANSYSA